MRGFVALTLLFAIMGSALVGCKGGEGKEGVKDATEGKRLMMEKGAKGGPEGALVNKGGPAKGTR